MSVSVHCFEGLNLTFPKGCCGRSKEDSPSPSSPQTDDSSEESPAASKHNPPRFKVYNRQPKTRGKTIPLVPVPHLAVRVVSANRPHISYVHAEYKDYPQLFDDQCLARDCTFCLIDAQGQLLCVAGPNIELLGCEQQLGVNMLHVWQEQQFFFFSTLFQSVAAGKKPQSALVYQGEQLRCCGYPVTSRNNTFYAALLIIRPDPMDFTVET